MRTFDLAVIGGGITGLGIARAAVKRGVTAALFERGALERETSANSHCIIHSGIRYIQKGALGRALESARALAEIRQCYPESVSPLPCWMPLNNSWLKGRSALWCGHILYRAALRGGGLGVPRWPGVVSRGRVPDHPLLRGRCTAGAFGWIDGWLHDHDGLVEKLRREVEAGGGTVSEGTAVLAVRRESGRFVVQLIDGETVIARAVADARGPSIGQSLGEERGGRGAAPAWCLGFNVVLSVDLSEGCGIAVSTESGRMLFVSPRRGGGAARSAIGTGYLPYDGHTAPAVEEADIAALIEEVRHACQVSVSLADVVSIESGVLPRDGRIQQEVVADPATRLYECDRYVVVQSGKYTGFPQVGSRVVRILRSFEQES